jgi:two-component system KDP operon response regulator KdpE
MTPENLDAEQGTNRPKIMIVDDDDDLRMALRLRLRANRFEIISASDGYSAMALAQKERPELVILDLGLPAGDGYVVMKQMQQSDTLSDIPIIVLTARDPLTNEDRSLEAGAMAFFQKPVDNNRLLDVIRATLRPAPAWKRAWPS